MISMASTADDSVQSTPTHSSRTFKVDDVSERTSPGSFDSCSISSKLSIETVPRSKSTDCLEKPGMKRDGLLLTPTHGAGSASPSGEEDGQKSPVQRIGVSMGTSVMAEIKARQEKRTTVHTSSPSSGSIPAPTLNNATVNCVKSKIEENSIPVVSGPTSSPSINNNAIQSSIVSQTKEKFGSSLNNEGKEKFGEAKDKFSISGGEGKEKFGVSVSEAKEKFSVSVSEAKEKFTSKNVSSIVTRRPPPVAPKPRPWSHAGADRRSGMRHFTHFNYNLLESLGFIFSILFIL